MSTEYKDEVGTFCGVPYFLRVRANPDWNNPSDFSVVLHFRDTSKKEGVEIAKIDNSHGRPHLHKYYRSDGGKEYVDVDIWDAVSKLEDNWRLYAEMFQKAHGRP